LVIFGAVDHGVSHDDFLGNVRQFADRDDFSGNLTLAFLLLESLEEKHRDQSGEDDRQVGYGLAEATNGHVEIGLPKAKGWSKCRQ